MLVVMQAGATAEQVEKVCHAIAKTGLTPHPIPGAYRTAIGITGGNVWLEEATIANLPGVMQVIRVTQPYKLTSREMKPEDTTFTVNNHQVGGGTLTVIAGPCSVESYEQTLQVAEAAKAHGAHILRAGAFKPRTSPYMFQGLGEDGLKILARVREAVGLPVISEALDTENFGLVEDYVDVIQIGARNMQNYSLLRRAGKAKKPVMLKRGFSATISEFLLAAEYIMAGGNYNVVLCERGIRTFSDHSRFTLDLSAVPELKRMTHLPVFVDPSHAAGKRYMVTPLARAAVAVGSDGIMVEVHHKPEEALSDGAQALTIAMFAQLMAEIRVISGAMRHETIRSGK